MPFETSLLEPLANATLMFLLPSEETRLSCCLGRMVLAVSCPEDGCLICFYDNCICTSLPL